MSFTEKYSAPNSSINKNLSEALLVNRRITTEEAEDFLHPKWELQHDPFEMLNMDKVVEQVWRAIEQKVKILVYSDYDADGIPGAVIMTDFFKKIGFKNYEVYIPNRNSEGFGLNTQACEKFIEQGVQLLITVDCGTSSMVDVQLLRNGGVEVVITDHHLPSPEGLPDCLILNPNHGPCTYPCKDLCGSGVVFKLVQALIINGRSLPNRLDMLGDMSDGWEKWLLDMVGIATICDMVPLVGENRVFAHYGLKVLQKSRRSGLEKILQLGQVSQATLNVQDVAFTVGPRINAASRIADPIIAFRALSDIGEEGVVAAEELEKLNRRRKTIVAQAAKKAYAKIESAPEASVIVVGDTNWPLGIVGLIAGNLANRYAKPAFVWTRVGEMYKGSARSGDGVSVHALMTQGSDFFESFGGHSAAGGFVCNADQVHKLSELLSEARRAIPREALEKVSVESVISIDEVSMANWRTIEALEPYGIGNPRPLFLLQSISPVGVRTFGKDYQHLALAFRQSNGNTVQAVRFNYTDLGIAHLPTTELLDVVVSFEVNTYRRAFELRLRVEDLFFAE